MSNLIPPIPHQELAIDRAHRLPKPSHIPEKLPIDDLAKIHFYHVKDLLLQYAHQHSPLPDPLCRHSPLFRPLARENISTEKSELYYKNSTQLQQPTNGDSPPSYSLIRITHHTQYTRLMTV